MTFVLIGMVSATIGPAAGQDDTGYQWEEPLNPGIMPTNNPLLPAINIMPPLPLPENLIPGTLFFNVQDFSSGYRIITVTLDARLYAYNITTGEGILPVSPNGQYGIYTVSDVPSEPVTCGILDMTTNVTVDRFETDGICENVAWSPNSNRVLLTTLDENGQSALAIRQDGQTTTFRPTPAGAVDIGGETFGENRIYFVREWISNDVISFEIGINGTLSQQIFARVGALDAGYPAEDLTLEQSGRRLVVWLPAQPINELFRGYWLTDVLTGNSFELAPPEHTALFAIPSPDDDAVAYWAAAQGPLGPTHPLRLVVYIPSEDRQVVLLQFDGPEGDILSTNPRRIVWNSEGIYFHITQREGAESELLTGTYRIQPDGTNLEFVSEEMLWDSLPPTTQ
jgi:hypothetical protein